MIGFTRKPDFKRPDGRKMMGKKLDKIKDKVHGCPECNGKRNYLTVYQKGLFRMRTTIMCGNCGYGVTAEGKRAALRKWNERAEEKANRP